MLTQASTTFCLHRPPPGLGLLALRLLGDQEHAAPELLTQASIAVCLHHLSLGQGCWPGLCQVLNKLLLLSCGRR